MKVSLSNEAPQAIQTACLVIGVLEDEPLSGPARLINEACGGRIQALIKTGDIDPDRNCITLLHGLSGVSAERVLVIGCGVLDKFDRVRFQNACLAAGRYLRDHAVTEAHVCLNQVEVEELDAAWRLREAIVAFDRANYRYIATKPMKADTPRPLKEISFSATSALAKTLERGLALAAGYRRARELGNLPPNICTPAYMAQQARSMVDRYPNCSIEILKRRDMAELGMDALLAVAQGSANAPRLIVLQYHGAEKDQKPHALVGKGVTFDTGGISLKPREGMDEMKYDMCGAASVIGTFEAVAAMQLKVNLVAIVAAVENMPDGKAYRPGDVVSSMSGKTIEILNTDAEGRLALCDALTYSERFEPQSVIDVATLTGACVVALGHHASAVMTKHDDLARELIDAGHTAVDRAWQLPLWEDYNSQIKSPFADMKNIGGVPAGAITAGCFLAKFTRKMRWAHVDMAGAAWKWNSSDGATGRPVGMLTQYLIDRCD